MKIHKHPRVLPAFFLASLPYAWLVSRFNWVCDDAYISFRYSKHLAQGYGFRFNPGDPPVEGFSNILWVLILAPIEAAGLSPVVWSRVLAIVCGVILLWRVTRFLAVQLKLPPVLLVLSAVFFATLPPIAVWSTSGLSTMLFALAFFLAFEFLLGIAGDPKVLLAGFAGAVLILCRAEGFVFAAFLFLLVGFRHLYTRGRESARFLLVPGLFCGITLGALTAFRLWYFGLPLPNTVYAKVGWSAMAFERGGKYLLNFALTFPALAVILIFGGLYAWRERSRSPHLLPAAVLGLAIWGYTAIVGGDFMAMGRFFVPSLPFIVILFGGILKSSTSRLPIAAVIGVALVVIGVTILPAFNGHLFPETIRRKTHFRWSKWSPDLFRSEYEQWKKMCGFTAKQSELGKALKEHTIPGQSLPRAGIGAIGYYSELTILDQAGLVYPPIARRRGRKRAQPGHDKNVRRAYFLMHKPTYFDAFIADDLPEGPLDEYIDSFFQDLPEKILALYAPIGIPLDPESSTGASKLLILLKRRDLLN